MVASVGVGIEVAEGEDVPVVVADALVLAVHVFAGGDDEPVAALERGELVVHGAADALSLGAQEVLVTHPAPVPPHGEHVPGVGIEMAGVVGLGVGERPTRAAAPCVDIALLVYHDAARVLGLRFPERTREPEPRQGHPLEPRRGPRRRGVCVVAFVEEAVQVAGQLRVGGLEGRPVAGDGVLPGEDIDVQGRPSDGALVLRVGRLEAPGERVLRGPPVQPEAAGPG